MDSRNIKDAIPDFGSKGLTKIYELQSVLIDEYIKIEGLPSYPLGLHSKTSQLLIKDFSARIVEELGECYESWEEATRLYSSDGSMDISAIKKALQNMVEELSDALHFFVEYNIYIGIKPENILGIQNVEGGEELEYMLERLPTATNIPFYDEIPKNPIQGIDSDNPFYKAGNQINQYTDHLLINLMWGVTYSLQKARNTLKNKPWKQTEMLTDVKLLKNNSIEGFLNLVCIFYILGFDNKDIFEIYFKKNCVNLFRIRSKY